MKQILVTGAGGQLGHALHLIAGSTQSNAAQFEWLFTDLTIPQLSVGRGISTAALDITDPEAVMTFFRRSRPDLVINCAAFTDVDRAETEREAAFRVNRDAPHILAKSAAAHGTALVHISTDFVFDGRADRPYTEQDLPAPLSVYGASKADGEQAVVSSGVRGAVVRTSWLYSPWGRNFVKAIMGVAADRSEISVVADQVGCPTSAASLAEAIVRMIPSLIAESSGPCEIYHFCDAGVVSRAEFAGEIIRLAGLRCRVVPVTSEEYPSNAIRPKYSALDTAKFTTRFNLSPSPWQHPLADCIKILNNS